MPSPAVLTMLLPDTSVVVVAHEFDGEVLPSDAVQGELVEELEGEVLEVAFEGQIVPGGE